MLLRHFNLREQPFGVTPDPSYLFDTLTHREALAGLLYGIQSGLGFIALTAKPGMGKTTILFEALTRLGKTARTVFLFQTISSATELIRAVLIDLGDKNPQGTLVDMEMRLNEILVKQRESGQRLVIVLDEAQNLDYSVLEAVRMLSNFETARHKLLQVILCGQLQLADRLAEPGLLQLRQRISIFATLKPLTTFETANYIEHRLKVAGYENSNPLFTPEAVSLIAHHSGGIPRNINNLCFNALSLSCALRENVIDADAVREVIGDLDLRRKTLPEPITVPEGDMDRFVQSAPSLPRKAWPGLRIAFLVALLFATALTARRWYLGHSGALHSLEMARASSPFRISSREKDRVQMQAPSVPRGDSSPTASVTHPDDRPPPKEEPSPQATVPSQMRAVAGATTAVAMWPSKWRYKTSVSRFGPTRKTSWTGPVQMIEARQGQSFAGICVEKFDGCSSALLNRIIELNPRIANPDYIQAGQRIILPVIETRREQSNRSPSAQ